MINCREAAELIADGRVVALPTDTVFGLAAKLEAADALYALKGREEGKPLIILGASTSALKNFVGELPKEFEALALAFWPGPLTLVVPANPLIVSERIRAGRSTIGLRIPSHVAALELLALTGPLAVTSANLSGEPSCKSAKGVLERFGKDFPLLEGEAPEHGFESTIIAGAGDRWQLLREGALSIDAIGAVLPAQSLSR